MTASWKLFFAGALTVACLPGCAADASDENADDTGEELAVSTSLLDSCADPGAILADGIYYVTCTGGQFPIYASDSATSGFHKVGDIFSKNGIPAWSNGDHWAPEIHPVPGGYAAYFTATSKKTGKHAIGVAFSKTVTGPYVDRGSPLVENDGSSIDSTMFTDPATGKLYLIWKDERTRSVNGHDVQADVLRGQELAPNGLHLVGAPPPSADTRTIMSSSEPWEEGVVEGPTMVKRGSYYYLFYSGAYYCNDSYGIGVARADSPLGPFTKHKEPLPGANDGRILKSGDHWLGPGHNSVLRGSDGKWHTFFHAYRKGQGTPKCGQNLANDNNDRHLLSATIFFQGGWPHVATKL